MRYYFLFLYLIAIWGMMSCGSTAGISGDPGVPSGAQRAYDAGIMARKEGNMDAAIAHFSKALEIVPDYEKARRALALALYEGEHWATAQDLLDELVQTTHPPDDALLETAARNELALGDIPAAQAYADKMKTPNSRQSRLRDQIKRLPTLTAELPIRNIQRMSDRINTAYPEYLPAFSLDGRELIFTRRYGNNEEFMISHLEDEMWTAAQPMDDINTPQNEGAQTLSADGSWLLFTGCNRPDGAGSCDIYYSKREGDAWSTPKPVGPPINDASWESQPSLTADQTGLYFSSSRAGGYGGMDIWYTRRTGPGLWSEPVNLGSTVNTPGDEQTPFIHPDGQTLYFTSDGHPGYGKTDIYRVRRRSDSVWVDLTHAGYPLNTGSAEGALAISTDGKQAYFTRADEARNYDLYVAELDSGFMPIPTSYYAAIVRDAVTDRLLPGALLKLYDADTDALIMEDRAGRDGRLILPLVEGKEYALTVDKQGYTFYSDRLTAALGFSLESPYEKELRLYPVVNRDPEPAPTEPIVLKNILFETNSDILDRRSDREITHLYDWLVSNPDKRIAIHGHTDNQGSASYNLALSQRRAERVREALVTRGISADRIEAQGYGMDRPIRSNDTSAGRAENRRVEMIILG